MGIGIVAMQRRGINVNSPVAQHPIGAVGRETTPTPGSAVDYPQGAEHPGHRHEPQGGDACARDPAAVDY